MGRRGDTRGVRELLLPGPTPPRLHIKFMKLQIEVNSGKFPDEVYAQYLDPMTVFFGAVSGDHGMRVVGNKVLWLSGEYRGAVMDATAIRTRPVKSARLVVEL